MAISWRSVLDDSERQYTVVFDRYSEKGHDGVIFHGNETYGTVFHGYMEMIGVLENCFRKYRYPKENMTRRSMLDALSVTEKTAFSVQTVGRSMTREPEDRGYLLRVTRLDNASWQGIVRDRQSGENCHFGSFLELVMWLDAHMGSGPDETAWEPSLREQRSFMYYLGLVLDCRDIKLILPDTMACTFREEDRRISFVIKMKFSGQKTWKGVLYQRETGVQRSFRSFLELACMINEAATVFRLSKETAAAAGRS